MSSRKPHIIIAAGGTGGHVYPAIAIADALVGLNPDTKITFVGTRTRMEWTAVPDAGYPIKSIWISGIHRRLTLKNLIFPLRLLVSIWQSFRLIKKEKPDAVISCGGFAAGPVSWVAGKMGIPLFIQEQNSFPGLTNRRLASKAVKIFTAFDDAAEYFPKDRVKNLGNPTRHALGQADRKSSAKYFQFDREKKTLLIIGGSGGAKSINDAMIANIEKLHNELGLQIIWQCGPNYYNEMIQEIDVKAYKNLRLEAFIERMDYAYGASDLAISRAGAISCAELMLLGKPTIMIPSPNVAGDHQRKNAASMVKAGAAVLVEDKFASRDLYQVVAETINDDDKLEMMAKSADSLAQPEAAGHIAEEILASMGLKKVESEVAV